MTHMDDIQYLVTELQENERRIRPQINRLTDKTNPLSDGETRVFRDLLRRNGSLVRLLNDTMTNYDPEIVSRWREQSHR